MSGLWRYKNSQVYDPIESSELDDEFFIYDRRDPVTDTTRWVSADYSDAVDLESML